ncbi:MAG: O-antigen ligase family protein [Arenimonas sp.]
MTVAPSRSESRVFVLAAITLSLAMLLGGGQGHPGDMLAQLSALALLAVLFWQQPDLRRWPKASAWVLLLFVPLLVYLLPWPEALRAAGSARQQLLQSLQPVLGGLPMPGSLNPSGTERAAFWLLPAAALYLTALQMPQLHKRRLAAVLVVWLFLGAILGLAQKFDGADSLLYFYSNTNRGMAVGLFANNNHYAIAMAAALPLVWASLVWRFNRRDTRHGHPLWFVLVSGMALVFIIGFMLSGSRAGLVLGMLGCLLMLPAIIAADQHQGAKHWLFAAMAAGLVISIQLGLYFIVLQFAPDPLLDARWQIGAAGREVATAFAPAGSGPGSFFFAFQHIDGLMFGPLTVNHAHNDYLELWLESRWLAVLPGAALLLAFLGQGVRIWFRSGDYSVHAVLLARAAWVGLLLLIIHSAVDYPLRTTAISAMAGLLAGFLVLPESERIAEPDAD